MAQAALKRLAGAAVLCGAGLGACDGINARTESYASAAEAQRAGAVGSGWLPDGLPAGTHEIRIGYVPGGNEIWGVFNFPPAEGDTLRAILAEPELPLTGLAVDVPGRIEWWPVALRGQLDGERLAVTGLKAYRTRDGARIVAVNWSQGRGYFWNAAK